MTVGTVKVNCGIRRSMNAGLAACFDSYYRAEEDKQIKSIVDNLILETSDCDYVNGVIKAHDMIQESNNTDQIKSKIFREYCVVKVKCS